LRIAVHDCDNRLEKSISSSRWLGLEFGQLLQSLLQREEPRLIAVCDRKARRYRAKHVFTDYESMLDLDLDLVDIVTPNPSHAKLAELALEFGRNVLVEKPMVLTSEECHLMIDAAKKSGRTLPQTSSPPSR